MATKYDISDCQTLLFLIYLERRPRSSGCRGAMPTNFVCYNFIKSKATRTTKNQKLGMESLLLSWMGLDCSGAKWSGVEPSGVDWSGLQYAVEAGKRKKNENKKYKNKSKANANREPRRTLPTATVRTKRRKQTKNNSHQHAVDRALKANEPFPFPFIRTLLKSIKTLRWLPGCLAAYLRAGQEHNTTTTRSAAHTGTCAHTDTDSEI